MESKKMKKLMQQVWLTTMCLALSSSLVLAQAKAGAVAQTKPGASGQAKPGASRQTRGGKRSKPGRKSYSGCDASTPVAGADGSVFTDSILDFSPYYDNFVSVNLKAGHSYAIEVWDPTETNETYLGNGVFLIPLLSDCATQDTAWVDIWDMDPDLSGGWNDRISVIQGSTDFEFIDVANFDGLNHNYYMRVVDTTLYNSRWSTVVGFTTHYGFLNTTETDVQGTLTLTESNGTQVLPVTFTIPAGGEVFETIAGDGSGSPGLNLAPNLAGSAMFAFVGSPGAIKADGYFQAVQNGVFVIVPTAWGPRDSQR
jgi:hypothetical protein